ncbi:MAG: molybdopterin-dependent oxidoreductase [Dehalococcoidia bacterium]|nr:molybdopterin-dependent oxidoreductase [Dehalococcoidia bacterium]
MDRTKAVTRARFLTLIGGGALLGYGGARVWGRAIKGWRYNTVEKPVPNFDPEEYRLVVDGMVERPLTLTYSELRALPAIRQVSDFHCVEGWGVDDVQWDGVRLQTIIDLVRPTSTAKYVTFHSLGDLYRDSLSMQQARLPDALVAYDMDGEPLRVDHGLPLRLVMPRMFGYKGPKWLTRIEFVDDQDTGYWEARGWRMDAFINA